VIATKLDRLAQCLARIDGKRPFDAARLATDADLQDVISVNLERAVQQCIDIAAITTSALPVATPTSSGASFDALAQAGRISFDCAQRLRRAVAFRNLLVHTYEKVDWVAVHGFLDASLDDLRRFAREISAAPR
jgi:uncharacterized protein YutE (UPF0331/DUF86 family)